MGAVPAAPLDPLSEDPRLLSSAVPLYHVLVRSCLSRTASCGLWALSTACAAGSWACGVRVSLVPPGRQARQRG